MLILRRLWFIVGLILVIELLSGYWKKEWGVSGCRRLIAEVLKNAK